MHISSPLVPIDGRSMRIGVISDTHGLLRPEALAALAGSDHILHAGDVGDGPILDTLREIAPVTAIRGNIDRRGDTSLLPDTDAIELQGRLFYLVHALADFDLNPVVARIDVVVSGHSHQSSLLTKEGVLYLNPGSAGPRRFKLPISIAIVEITPNHVGARINARILEL